MGRPGGFLIALCTWLAALCLLGPAFANDAAPMADDPALEARMTRIASELRCLVCQNQTIADSNASLAVDLRREARALIKQGKTDAEVVDYMTARYGDFVLYRPPLKTTTALLWFGPAAMLAIGAAVLLWVLRRRSTMASAPKPSSSIAAGPNHSNSVVALTGGRYSTKSP